MPNAGGATTRSMTVRGRPCWPRTPPRAESARRRSAQPAAPAEQHVEGDDRDGLGAEAERHEGAATADVVHQPAEVLPEEAGEEGERQKDGGDDRQLLHH